MLIQVNIIFSAVDSGEVREPPAGGPLKLHPQVFRHLLIISAIPRGMGFLKVFSSGFMEDK